MLFLFFHSVAPYFHCFILFSCINWVQCLDACLRCDTSFQKTNFDVALSLDDNTVHRIDQKAEFLSMFAVRGTDIAKALPHLKSTSLEELEDKIVWLQRAPVSLGWTDVSQLLIAQSSTFASFDLDQATKNVTLVNELLQANTRITTISEVLSRAPKLLTSSTLERDVEGLKELGLTADVLGQLASLHAPVSNTAA